MLFNVKENKPQRPIDCLHCKYFDTKTKQCKGIGKNCFLYDPKTRTLIDGITGLPIKLGKDGKPFSNNK